MKPPFGAAIFLPLVFETSYIRARACVRAPSFKQTVNDGSADASLISVLAVERPLNSVPSFTVCLNDAQPVDNS
jgi:hypothetical protein